MIAGRPRSRRVKETGPETMLFQRRALAGFALFALCLVVLLGRFAWLQVRQHAEFHGRSEANRIKPRALPPSRGLVYDRNGALLDVRRRGRLGRDGDRRRGGGSGGRTERVDGRKRHGVESLCWC